MFSDTKIVEKTKYQPKIVVIKSLELPIMRYCLTVFLFYAFSLSAQEISSPLDIPLLLSGNFGELRSSHFHSGLDFKTQGRTGLPVKSVMEGYIARISVSPYGYGRAVYIQHPCGLTSVYGHLERFSRKIEAAVRDSQYAKESFAVDLHFSPEDFPLKRGEIFAFSGNTGGSGGPHLHFELRHTATEKPVDPLPFFLDRIADTRPPEIRAVKLFPVEGLGAVDGMTAWGLVGVGVKAYDRMDGTGNIYGVREILLKLDGQTLFHSSLDSFSFDQTRYLNSFIDWPSWKFNREFYMKSFIEQGNRLQVYQWPDNGTVNFCDERTYRFEYILTDAAGNTVRYPFTVEGRKMNIPQPPHDAQTLFCNADNLINADGLLLEIPKGNLYSDLRISIQTENCSLPLSPCYSFGVQAPLHDYCRLTLSILNDTIEDKSKYGIVALNQGRKSWIGGSYANGKITADIREIGVFTVDIDTVPPSVVMLRNSKTAQGSLAFRISDDLSGIRSWRATLDGRFAIFEYETKQNLLFCKFDPARMQRGKQTLCLEVEDGAGNRQIINEKVVFP